MSDFLLETTTAKQIWNVQRNVLYEYYKEFSKFQFIYAINIAESFISQIRTIEEKTNNTLEDSFYNDCFLMRYWGHLLECYATYWNQIMNGEFHKSWDSLQDTISYLKTLNKFSSINKTIVFRFLERQLQGLEKIYPYRLFTSPEMLFEKSQCNICGKNSDSFDCPHILGELYRGKLAHSSMKPTAIIAVSIVKHPADKRCIIPSNAPLDGPEHLQKYLISVPPLRIADTIETTLDGFHKKNGVKNNFPCPCGSAKKYTNCCLQKNREIMNIEIVSSHVAGFTIEDFVHLQ